MYHIMSLRVAIITQDEPFYMPSFYESFFSFVPNGINIEWVTVLSTFDESFLDLVKRTYRLYGPWNFLYRGIEYTSKKIVDTVGFRSHSVKSIVRSQDIRTDQRETVNTGEYINMIRNNHIDVIFSVSAPEVFESAVLDAPNWGCINVHTSKLPKYRGMLPTFWALYHDDDELGITVHTMAEEIDKGKIVKQNTIPISSNATLDDVILMGKSEGGRLAAEALENIMNHNVELTEMEGDESYFSFPTVEERKEFQRRGNELL
jgi:methionyl-tRNA formyltransferase